MNNQSFSKKEAIKFGWSTFKQRPGLLMGVFLILFLINYLPAFALPPLVEALGGEELILFVSIVSIISVIIGLLLSLGIINLTLKLVDGKEVAWIDLVSKANRFGTYLLVSLIYMIIVIVGFIIFIIPGIYLSMKYYFSHYLVVDKGMKPGKALKRSGKIMYGNKWNLLILSLILALINMVAGLPKIFVTDSTPIFAEMILSVGLLVSMPVSYLANVYVYRKLEKNF